MGVGRIQMPSTLSCLIRNRWRYGGPRSVPEPRSRDADDRRCLGRDSLPFFAITEDRGHHLLPVLRKLCLPSEHHNRKSVVCILVQISLGRNSSVSRYENSAEFQYPGHEVSVGATRETKILRADDVVADLLERSDDRSGTSASATRVTQLSRTPRTLWR